MPKTTIAYIALGSNLQNPTVQISTAISYVENILQTRLIATSSFYKSAPMGPQNQDDFINAVIKIETDLEAKTLLHATQAIELKMGRVRIERWGPRIIDLDILLFGNCVFQDNELTLPHPGVFDRIFFLKPLQEIAPELRLPDGRKVAELLQLIPQHITAL